VVLSRKPVPDRQKLGLTCLEYQDRVLIAQNATTWLETTLAILYPIAEPGRVQQLVESVTNIYRNRVTSRKSVASRKLGLGGFVRHTQRPHIR
jgi:hypothetical protein